MQTLIKGTTAYAIFSADRTGGRLSHAYMLHLPDPDSLRGALKIFAAEFFGATGTLLSRIENESYTDLVVYPAEGKKITAEGVAEIIEDSAMKPVEGDKKLYVFVGFDSASALVQNKLLKTLEEPPENIHFLLGVTSLAPVLDTVKSRVKLLEIPPFSKDEIFEALERKGANKLNGEAAESCNGVFGAAVNMVYGGWFGEVCAAAKRMCSVKSIDEIAPAAAAFGDSKYKREILSQMQNYYFAALTGKGGAAGFLTEHTLIYALGCVNDALADLKFNAYFQALLYDLMLKVVKENDRWLKLQE